MDRYFFQCRCWLRNERWMDSERNALWRFLNKSMAIHSTNATINMSLCRLDLLFSTDCSIYNQIIVRAIPKSEEATEVSEVFIWLGFACFVPTQIEIKMNGRLKMHKTSILVMISEFTLISASYWSNFVFLSCFYMFFMGKKERAVLKVD